MNETQLRKHARRLDRQCNEFLKWAQDLNINNEKLEKENLALKRQIKGQQEKIEGMITEVMEISAKESETRDELRELKLVIDRATEQRDHNCCVLNVKILYEALGKKMPEFPETKWDLAYMFWGCENYVPTLYKTLTRQETEHVERLRSVTREYLHDLTKNSS
jgi:DNA repair exonuclease SbcCD ATPase subunit